MIVKLTLSMVGPVVSARIILCPPMPNMGSMAMVSTSMPMPPSQWVKERQKSMLFDTASIFVSMVDPVVVKPEAISKKASANLGISPVIMKGTAPIADSTIHALPTMKNPSLMRMSYSFMGGVSL